MLLSCLGYRLQNPQPHLLDIARANVAHEKKFSAIALAVNDKN